MAQPLCTHAPLPARVETLADLEELLSRPTPQVCDALSRLEGDLLVLGVGGKMGPSLARMARRACDQAGLAKRVIGVSRFSTPGAEQALRQCGVETIACDLLADGALAALPDARNVIYMAGMKFGATGHEPQTWAMNAFLPGLVAQRYRGARLVVFSSGNVYPFSPLAQGGCTEETAPVPVGEYAQSVLGRERVFEYFAVRDHLPLLIYRLNYAVELRYGVLLDVARKVWEGQPLDLSMGQVNVIWQGDANAYALQALSLAETPPRVLNVTGPETVSLRYLAQRFGQLLDKTPLLTGVEQPEALLNNAALAHQLLGYPQVPLGCSIAWVADWVRRSSPTLDKPTRFEVRDGSSNAPRVQTSRIPNSAPQGGLPDKPLEARCSERGVARYGANLRAECRKRLLQGGVIPACPLALTAERRLDERRQRALLRYYVAAGASGVAVGVHTTQFAIHDPQVGLYRPVLELAAETVCAAGQPALKVAGIVGLTPQALREAALAASLGYDCGLLSLAALQSSSDDELVAHCRAVAEVLPLVGFYLQPAVGGRILSYAFWRRFLEIEAVVAIKIAPFSRYQTLDVLRAVADSGRSQEVALYTGNDDHIVDDLLGEARFSGSADVTGVRIVGGLLGHWAVWTRHAVEIWEQCHAARQAGQVPAALLTLGAQVTDCNAAFFDAAHNYAGCIAGLHAVLARQGLLAGLWCLDPREGLSPGQMQEIERVYAAYPLLNDDAFVAEHLAEWLA